MAVHTAVCNSITKQSQNFDAVFLVWKVQRIGCFNCRKLGKVAAKLRRVAGRPPQNNFSVGGIFAAATFEMIGRDDTVLGDGILNVHASAFWTFYASAFWTFFASTFWTLYAPPFWQWYIELNCLRIYSASLRMSCRNDTEVFTLAFLTVLLLEIPYLNGYVFVIS